MKQLFGLTTAVMLAAAMTASTARAAEVKLIAAGSLKSALGDVASAFADKTGIGVATTFGPSGLMRKKIEAGEDFDVFASANMKHPQALHVEGKAGPVRLFARNRLCALAQGRLEITTESLLDLMLDPDVRLGTSTPKADPSGDYAFQLFDKADAVEPGSTEKLKAKSLQLTGGETSEKAPGGRNQYGWVMETGKADIFLTYYTNAVLAKREVPALKIIAIPDDLSVGADYGLTIITGAPDQARQLGEFILAPEGQRILAGYGFEPAGPTQ